MSDRRRVLVPQALGADEFLRVTWHDGRRLMVFSQWDGDRCVAATPVKVEQLGELAELVVTAFTRSSTQAADTWPAPVGADVVALDPPTRSPTAWQRAEVRPA
jgi:hypothetical protein